MSPLKSLSLLTLLLFYPFILLGQACNQTVPAITSHLLDQMKGTTRGLSISNMGSTTGTLRAIVFMFV